MTQRGKQQTELIGIFHLAEELARDGLTPLLTTRNTKGIDMMVSNETGSKSLTLQVKTIRLENEKENSFPVFSAPESLRTAGELYAKMQDDIAPSENKWWAFMPVESGKVLRYFVANSQWVYELAKQKADEYLGLGEDGAITAIAKGGPNRGKPLTFKSLGVVGFYISDFSSLDSGLGLFRAKLRPEPPRSKTDYVWYAGYGSNTLRERFIRYIEGGKFRLGGTDLTGCRDKTPPVDTDDFLIPHEMYFAGRASGWKCGGTALLDPRPTTDESKFTRGRIWKVTWEQFEDIWRQEGKTKHDQRLSLGPYADGCEIATFTCSRVLETSSPATEYLQTIALGLRETFALSSSQVLDYLSQLGGISGKIQTVDLKSMIESALGKA